MAKSRPPPVQRQKPCELRIDIESCPSSSCSLDLPASSMGEPSPSMLDPNSLSPLYPLIHASSNEKTTDTNSPRRGSTASGASGASSGRGESTCANGRRIGADGRRRRSIWAAAQTLQQLRKARQRGGRRGSRSFIPLSMLRNTAFSFSGGGAGAAAGASGHVGGAAAAAAGGGAALQHHDLRPGRVQLIANRSASQDRRDRGRREREEYKKMALACYAVVCCVGAYALFSYVAFFMNG